MKYQAFIVIHYFDLTVYFSARFNARISLDSHTKNYNFAAVKVKQILFGLET